MWPQCSPTLLGPTNVSRSLCAAVAFGQWGGLRAHVDPASPRFPPRPLSVVAVWNGLFSLPIGYQD